MDFPSSGLISEKILGGFDLFICAQNGGHFRQSDLSFCVECAAYVCSVVGARTPNEPFDLIIHLGHLPFGVKIVENSTRPGCT